MREWFQKLKFKIYTKNQLSDAFDEACKEGNVSTIQYLLTPAMFNKYKDTYNLNYGFRFACEYGHLEVVRYLLTSPELKEHINIHVRENSGFIWSIYGEGFIWAGRKDNWIIMEYLLTFSDNRYINFQKTKYNLNWAISEKHHNIVKAMAFSLCENDIMSFLENIPKIEKYCLDNGLDFNAWQEEMIKEDIMLNPKEEELFI